MVRSTIRTDGHAEVLRAVKFGWYPAPVYTQQINKGDQSCRHCRSGFSDPEEIKPSYDEAIAVKQLDHLLAPQQAEGAMAINRGPSVARPSPER